ncbi:MAG: hypothetical protein WC275_03510, partial [Bacilli bacterium]
MSGFVGRVSDTYVKDDLIKALKLIEFDDDDSTGVLFCDNKNCAVHRIVGKVDDLVPLIPEKTNGKLGIGHIRNSTYMRQSLKNVYPIMSENDEVSLIVHGLIDNVGPLRRKLIRRGFNFKTESAIEVVANLIEENLRNGVKSLEAL